MEFVKKPLSWKKVSPPFFRKKKSLAHLFLFIFSQNASHLTQLSYIFFYRQLDFSSEPGVANEILENEPKSCLTVA